MHDDVAAGIFGFVGGPPHLRAVARDAVTARCHFVAETSTARLLRFGRLLIMTRFLLSSVFSVSCSHVVD